MRRVRVMPLSQFHYQDFFACSQIYAPCLLYWLCMKMEGASSAPWWGVCIEGDIHLKFCTAVSEYRMGNWKKYRLNFMEKTKHVSFVMVQLVVQIKRYRPRFNFFQPHITPSTTVRGFDCIRQKVLFQQVASRGANNGCKSFWGPVFCFLFFLANQWMTSWGL